MKKDKTTEEESMLFFDNDTLEKHYIITIDKFWFWWAVFMIFVTWN